jgi:hypothetical protein
MQPYWVPQPIFPVGMNVAQMAPVLPAYQYSVPMSVVVIDPASRKLTIPMEAIFSTNAMHATRIPSLCLLFLSGRCRQGALCNQVHAEPEVVNRLRAESQTLSSCCPEHGEDILTAPLSVVAPHITTVHIENVQIPVQNCGTTNGLRRALAEGSDLNVLVVPKVLVCRLHLQRRCRYGEDCNFVHICLLHVQHRGDLFQFLSTDART